MWTKVTKLSHVLKSKQGQDCPAPEPLAGPSTSPSKRSSLRLNNIPKKVKSTFNLQGNSSQLTLSPGPSSDLSRRSSIDALSTSRPKATRRSSFNILITRRPSIDVLRSPPETPYSMSHQEHSQNSIQTRNRAATFGGSVRSILREPNTPTAGKSVRFFPCDAPDVAHAQHPRGTEHRPAISRSTPPEETLFLSDFDLSNAPSAMPRSASSSRYRRPSAVEVFSPFGSTTESPHQGSQPHLVNFFEKIDAPATTWGLDVPNIDLPGPLAPAPHLDGGQEMGSKDTTVQTVANPVRKAKKPRHSVSHDRNTSFSFGQAVFHSMDESDSKRSSSGKSSLMSDAASDMTSASSMTSSSSSPSVGRHRSVSDTVFVSMMRGSPAKVTEETNNELSQSAAFVGKGGGASQPDPFSANATTYYTPQTMIPTTPPQGTLRHARRASKEENIIFSLKTQLALQSELIGQFEADLRARDELVEVLGKRLAEAEEEDVKKRKFLRAWKKKVAELEKKCRFFEDEVEGSRQESMERSIMDEASSEALQMLHRQIAGLERERDAWRRTEGVLREEVRRLDVLAGDRLNEATMLKESLTGRSDKEGQQMSELEAEKRRHKALELAWQAEKEDMLLATDSVKLNNIGLVADLDDLKQQLKARDDKVSALNAELSMNKDRAETSIRLLEAVEAGKCALAMERDSLRLQLVKLQDKKATADEAERRVLELEDDLQGFWDIRKSLEKERDQLKERIQEEEPRLYALAQKLKASETRATGLEQERQYALDKISRLEDRLHCLDLEAAETSQQNLMRASVIKELQEQIKSMRREQAVTLEELNSQNKILLECRAEVERLNGQTRELQQENANKEVQIVQITEQRAQDKHDLEGLNVALGSKQQELELLKRRLGVRGTVGNTPTQPNKPAHQRRDSSVSITAQTSRPMSFTSEAGAEPTRERKPSAESCNKTPALSKSRRLSSSATAFPAPPKSTRGSMGPPPLRPRGSIVGTPTTTSRTLTRSSSLACTSVGIKPKASKPGANTATPRPAGQGEKENADVQVSGSKRISRIPTLAQ